MSNLLEIKDLHVSVEDNEILHGLNLTIKHGETVMIFGPNGGGKTTLLMSIMGFPKYKITSGQIIFDGHDVTNMTLDERARLGIGMAFQRPPIIKGIKTRDMLKVCLKDEKRFEEIHYLAERANMTKFLDRGVNYGFSGGETKRSEMMQILAQQPELVLLDEPESGVDLENMALIGKLINDALGKDSHFADRTKSGLIISHTGHILEYVNSRTGYVLINGRISCEGDPRDILASVKEHGYTECASCQRNK